MQREQKTAKAGYPCEGMVETESNKGVRSIASLENAEKNGAETLWKKVSARFENLKRLKIPKEKAWE